MKIPTSSLSQLQIFYPLFFSFFVDIPKSMHRANGFPCNKRYNQFCLFSSDGSFCSDSDMANQKEICIHGCSLLYFGYLVKEKFSITPEYFISHLVRCISCNAQNFRKYKNLELTCIN